MTKKLPQCLRKLGLTSKDIFFDDELSDEFIHDKRRLRWNRMKKRYGFDDRELWDLDFTLAVYIYPRLKYFREHYANDFHPCDVADSEEWKNILDTMLFAFEDTLKKDSRDSLEVDDYKAYNDKIAEGLMLFGKYFQSLWW